jgi:crossover junction endodeoxyribonuclease RuvC
LEVNCKKIMGSVMTVLGIDIGCQGAIAQLDTSGALLDINDMPALKEGTAKRRVINAPLLASIIFKSHAEHAFVEYVSARPTDGSVQAFAFGRARGVIEGVLGAVGIPVTFITPQSWKRAVGLPPGKNKQGSRSEAIRRWPSHSELFSRAKDDGRAEACLIAVAGLMRSGLITISSAGLMQFSTSTWHLPVIS